LLINVSFSKNHYSYILIEEIFNYFTGKISFSESIDTNLIENNVGDKRKSSQTLNEKELEKKVKLKAS